MENKLLELIKTRRSCRRYRPVQIEDRELAAVLEAGTFAPTSMGRQDPWIVAVQRPDLLDRLARMNAEIMGSKGNPYYDAPTVVLVDIAMPKRNGFAAAEEALRRWPGLKIITLSMYGDEDYYFRMVSLGVKGFILKNSDIKDVVAAIEAVVEGGSFFSQELLFNLVSNLKSAPSAVPDDSAEQLSQRESEILLHICRGESNNEIADALFISKRTVDKHRSNILAKTGCKNTANLVVYAIKNNLVEI